MANLALSAQEVVVKSLLRVSLDVEAQRHEKGRGLCVNPSVMLRGEQFYNLTSSLITSIRATTNCFQQCSGCHSGDLLGGRRRNGQVFV